MLLILAMLGSGTLADRAAALQNAIFVFSGPPNVVRVIMFLLLGGVLVLVTWRGRMLLHRAVAQTVARARLAQFLPAEIASLVGRSEAASLREGRRQTATVVFVDMRESTARAETLDPRALSVFISSFRRRVTDAARRHGGVIDKFIGDGALVVFGVPEPQRDDAGRALAFAAELLDRIERWNAKRGFDTPVRVGIGVHTGEVYCGLVGDEARLEFTVLGDAVNVAARLEDATKRYGRPVLASDATIEAAGRPDWSEVGREVLRGRAQPTAIMAS
jgi:adenylate cyclase